jgi:hypothetical protein
MTEIEHNRTARKRGGLTRDPGSRRLSGESTLDDA